VDAIPGLVQGPAMIRVHHDGPVATIALARPEARNALPIAAWEALADAAAQVAEARVVVLKSDVKGIFSAGADVGEFQQLHTDSAIRSTFRSAMRTAIEAIATLPMPVIAEVDGGCFGAAVALILAADIRVAGNHAEFATTPAKFGLGYPREDVARLIATIGRGLAATMLFTGDRIRADEAKKIGLIDLQARSPGEVTASLTKTIAANAPEAIRLLKRTLLNPEDATLDQSFEDSFGGAEFGEGLAAFRAKRKAVFP
jgi:enoyl-CoA hydratase/carnithine racemase